MDYIILFLLFAKVSLLTFGGGLASLPFLYQVFVTDHSWMTDAMFSETIALAQMTPGPIILNSATLLGYRHMGMAGSLVATSAVTISPLLVVMALDWVFKHASGRARLWVDRLSYTKAYYGDFPPSVPFCCFRSPSSENISRSC